MTNPYLITPLGILLGAIVGFIAFVALAHLTRRVLPGSPGLGRAAELFPAFSLDVPGRPPRAHLHTRSQGTPADPLDWKRAQFVDEFEAHIAETFLQNNSEEMLVKVHGGYQNEFVNSSWTLWCRAIALTHAKTKSS